METVDNAAAEQAEVQHPISDQAPNGYTPGHHLQFIDGVLHRLFHAPYAGPEPQQVLVPVAGQEPSTDGATDPRLTAEQVERMIESRISAFARQVRERITHVEARLFASDGQVEEGRLFASDARKGLDEKLATGQQQHQTPPPAPQQHTSEPGQPLSPSEKG